MTGICDRSDPDIALEKFLSVQASFGTALANLVDVADLTHLYESDSRAATLSEDFLRKLEMALRKVSISINCSLVSIDLLLAGAAGRRGTDERTRKASEADEGDKAN